MGKMPGNSLSFAIRVSGKIYLLGLGCVLFKALYELALSGHDNVHGLKIVLHIHPQMTLRQISDMSHGSGNLIIVTQIFFYGFCLGWRLHNDEIFGHPYPPTPYLKDFLTFVMVSLIVYFVNRGFYAAGQK
jgi:hypothetical protein